MAKNIGGHRIGNGKLVLGTLGNVSAHADDAPSQRTTDATTKAVNGPTVDQTTRQVTLKSGTPAPVTSDESKTSMPANNDKKTVTPVVSPKTPVNKPDQPAVPESTQVVKQPVTAVHTPVTPAVPANATPTPENEQPVQPAQMPAVAPTTTTKTPATTQAIDEWMPDKNLQQIVLKALQLSQKKGETPYTDVSQITQDNVAQLTKINPNYGRWINGDIVRGDTLYKAILNVTDLTGLEKATNLEELNLSTDDPNVDPDAQAEGKTWTRGALKDLSKLSGLENLSHLDIAETSVSDLTPILNLPKLTSLVAHDALIQTLQPNGVTTSSVLDNLTYLDLDRNQLTSLAGLENNTQLSSLMAQDNKIKSVQPLANISVPMSILYLGGNQIYDLSPLSKIDFQNGYLDVWKQTAFLNKPITVDTAKDSYDFESPVLDNVATEQALKAYLGGEIAKTSLKATPTDAFANKITLNGIVKYGKKYIIFSWGQWK